MSEMVKAVAKKPEAKRENKASQTQKTGPSRSISSPVDQILFLQRTIGNQAVGRLIKSGALQAKLRISQPHDIYEQEADRVAEQVMRMPEPRVSNETKVTNPARNNSIQRKCPGCKKGTKIEKEEEEEILQKKEASGATHKIPPELESLISPVRGGGQPLSETDRAFFEPRFGHDFSQVRVHSGADAGQSARDLDAKAYTMGNDIVFGAGQFTPGTHEGQRLIGHELTHVVQQGGAKNNIPAKLSIQKTSGHQVMRSLALDSTVNICRRVLISRNIKVTQGGLRVVLLLNPLDKGIPNCQNHKFWVTLTKSVDWGFDDEIATCEGETGGTRSFLFGNVSSGTYYLTIHRVFDHPYCCIDGDILVFDEPISGDSSGCVRDKDLSAMDIVHGALDIAGFIPVLGAIPDGINAAIYVVEGDWANAGLSAVAMVPAWGDGVKLGAIAGKSAIKISEKAAIKLGEEGIAKGLKEVKAASKATHAAEEAAKLEKEAAKLEKEAAEKLKREATEKSEKEAAQKKKKEKKEKKEEKKEEQKKKSKKCSDELLGLLYAAVKTACDKKRSCTMQGDTCESATAKVSAGYACTAAREKIQKNCFSPGDPGYEGHMQQIAEAYAALRECIRVMSAKCRR